MDRQVEIQDTTSSTYRILLGLINLGSPAPPPLPTASVTSFGFAGVIGTVSAQPQAVIANANATSLTYIWYESSGSTDSGYSSIRTGSETPSGSNTITDPLATIVNRWYYMSATVTNETGSVTVNTAHLQNLYTPTATLSLSPCGLVDPGTDYAMPDTTIDSTGATTLEYALYEWVDGTNRDILIDGPYYETYPINPSLYIQASGTVYTEIGKRFLYKAVINAGTVNEVSAQSVHSMENYPV